MNPDAGVVHIEEGELAGCGFALDRSRRHGIELRARGTNAGDARIEPGKNDRFQQVRVCAVGVERWRSRQKGQWNKSHAAQCGMELEAKGRNVAHCCGRDEVLNEISA